MRILGIDPGSINCGYGLIYAGRAGRSTHAAQKNRSSRGFEYISSGRICMPSAKPLHERLKNLFECLSEVISETSPDEIVIEQMFFAKGVKAAISFGHTRGVVLLAASMSGIPIFEYTPLEVKQAVVGYGRADKNQVQHMVKEILDIRHQLSADGADALAIALCHANMQGPLSRIKSAAAQLKVVKR